APEPLAIASGRQPRINAKEVIRIGRNRNLAPVSAAVLRSWPFSYLSLANSTIRIAFLAARPKSTIRPTCAYILNSIPQIHNAANAPHTAIGVLSRTLKGRDQLS